MSETEQNEICELVRKAENDYISGTTNISKYVEFSQYENVEKIDAYVNSKHTSGELDAQGREKPFFNLVTAARNIWYRATDIDRKNIKIKASKKTQYLAAFIATLHLQEWMKRNNFGAFLNEWGKSLATYGSSVLKFVEKDGELIPSIIPWNRLVTDTVDFENNPKIEILWYTPAQLRRNKSYDQDMVKALLETKAARETIGRQKKDSKSDYIKVYEVHGELELSNLTDNEADEDTFVQQMHVVTFLARKDNRKTVYDDFTLFKGKEAQDPYLITHLIKEDGRAMAIGAVEHLFEAQWMKNHTVKAIKDYLDVASKLILQTQDGNFVGQNALNAIENGDILVHSINAPLTLVNTAKPDITQLENFGKQWEVLAQEITSTPDAMRGDNAPSGTAWRQVQALQQESHSLFELMTENKGIHLEGMMRKFVIPSLKKEMDTTDELAATLDSQGITQFDAMYVPNEAIRRANNQIKQQVLSGQIASQPDPQQAQGQIKQELGQQGNTRFIKPSDMDDVTWKESLKDLEWDVEVDVTSESVDSMNIMTTLSTVLQTLATNPNVLRDPNMQLLFNKILEQTGAVSPLEMQTASSTMPMGMMAPVRKVMNFKDLPPDGQAEMAQQAGIQIQPQQQPQGQQGQIGGGSSAAPLTQGK